VKSGTAGAAESDQDPGALAQAQSDSRVDSDMPRQDDTKRQAGKERKGDATLLGQKQFVSFRPPSGTLGSAKDSARNS